MRERVLALLREPRNQALLALCMLSFATVWSSAIDTVVGTRVAKNMTGYEVVWSQLVYSVLANLVNWSFLFAIHRFTERGRLPAEVWDTPRGLIILIGLFRAVDGLLDVYPTTYLPASFHAVVYKLSLPFTMVQCYLLLGTRYRPQHLVGVALVTVGAVVAVWSDMELPSGTDAFYLLLLVASLSIPEAPLTEKVLKRHRPPAQWLRCQYAWWEFVFSVLTIPVMLIHMPERENVEPDNLFSHIYDGFACYFGHDTDNGGTSHDALCAGDTVAWGAVFFAANLVQNVAHLLLIQSTSAVFDAAVEALILPATVLLTQWRWLAGSAAEDTPDLTFVISLLLVSGGIYVYARVPEAHSQALEGAGDGAGYAALASGDGDGRKKSLNAVA